MLGREPGGNAADELGRLADERLDATARLEGDEVARPDPAGGAVDRAAVYLDMAVHEELPRLGAGRGKPEPVEDTVEPELE